ncbi:hypothetical protein M011DRAFT_21331 [Sporormia fimetaria CBS 119925]|uniref:Uncharacterized protein n=1 Tax=Sporormia fimetaria CBS 119925 TaxID=1340428 RepID=A0A6A6VRU3_9PLEO|nr:hypothetical protein M011DRAFT_21331 [Sporormia fimetaria CBS 119925]
MASTTSLSSTIPLLTPAPSCFSDIWADVRSCDGVVSVTSSCTVWSLGRNAPYDYDNVCMTDGFEPLPGTRCPISYTEVDSNTTVLRKGTTTGQLTCCPDVQSFTYIETGFNSVGRCAAVSPTIPGITLDPPWTITFSETSERNLVTHSAVFDPVFDTLVAPAVSMAYAVENGVTCAPNCAPPRQETPSGYCNRECKSWSQIMIVVIVLPILVAVMSFGCCFWCWISGKRRADERIQKNRDRIVAMLNVGNVEGLQPAQATVESVEPGRNA